jgi:nucleotide-binding universal stress UspA family protein
LLHVLQDLVAMVPEPGMAFAMPGDYLKDLREGSKRAMAELAKTGLAAGVRVVQETREGPPFLEIVRYAQEGDIDLIVMGTHGRTGLAHALMGSVAEKVVRKAPCPVLTVRHPEHEFVKP